MEKWQEILASMAEEMRKEFFNEIKNKKESEKK